ncbi:MAG TPA: SigE family RNA polymerase sigma factor [Micromonosporaceae bacterium]|jgi:RNA polymerase sigma-70 factor (sigma-E family)|nr:SigE family RNA polymerase sigma factor [Micromonosporaceae bacterium]
MTFDEYVGHRLGALVRYASVVTCDPYLAEDIVQEVLVRAQSRWTKVAKLDQPEAYLKRMVLNEFLSWRRRRSARVIPLGHAALDASAEPAADRTGEFDQRDEMLRRIAALPPKQRAAIALRYYDGLSDPEIADLLGCAPATVRSHCARALNALRAAMALTPTASVPEERG